MAPQCGQPRGRAPVGYVWKDGRWLHVESGEPYSAARQHFKHLETRKIYERHRYWDPSTGVRLRRLERSAREGWKPFKLQPLQVKLHDLAGVRGQLAEEQSARDVNLLGD